METFLVWLLYAAALESRKKRKAGLASLVGARLAASRLEIAHLAVAINDTREALAEMGCPP